MKKYFLAILLVTTLTGCATPYQRESNLNPTTGGYSDEKLSDNKFYITFRGNPKTTIEQVEAMWNRRASELCPKGYESDYLKTESVNSQSVYASGIIIESSHMFPTVEGTATCE